MKLKNLKLLFTPAKLINALLLHKNLSWFNRLIPDDIYLRILFYIRMGYKLNLKQPRTFNEKLQWLKLYDRNPRYTTLVDKFAVKEYVSNIIGEEYIIPTLGVWNSFEDIDFSQLPDQFVLKCTHDSGGLIICRDKNKLDINVAKDIITDSLKRNYYLAGREWPYKNVKPRIIAEEYIAPRMSNAPCDIPDFKFYCFDGEPVYCQVIRDRRTEETIDFYDMNWKHQVFVGLTEEIKNGSTEVPCPQNLEVMKTICRKLSKNIPFARIDLYEVDGKEYFGEVTFYPASGFGKFTPNEYNELLGNLIKNTPPQKNKLNNKVLTSKEYRCTFEEDEKVSITLLDNEYLDLKDYKFFCFNGLVRCFKVDFDRFVCHHANYYTIQGELLPFGEQVCTPLPEHKETLPDNFEKMVEIASKLSKGLPFARIDLYNNNGIIHFGEITFFPASGFGLFTINSIDEELGNLILINK